MSDLNTDDLHEIADSQVDIYTSALAQWYADHSGNRSLCEEAASDGLVCATQPIEDRIKAGQFVAIQRILGSLVESIESQREEEEGSDDGQSANASE